MRENLEDDVHDLMRRLIGAGVESVQRFRSGRNSRIYCVEAGGKRYALKSYADKSDGRDRLGTEYAALTFLHGLGAPVPQPIARDTALGCGLYEWIDGEHLASPNAEQVEQVVRFLATIHEAARAAPDRPFGAAAEAALSRDAVIDHIFARLRRLRALGEDQANLALFLDDFEQAFALHTATGMTAEGRDVLARAAQTLSPSDFSVHNALRRPDGRLVFLDFEYFGWDDPVKLVSDFIWHPAMRLEAPERRQFLRGVAEVYGNDPSFARRLRARFPLFGLKWCMIVLNEFFPERWQGRVFAQDADDWDIVKARQLATARGLLERVRSPLGALE